MTGSASSMSATPRATRRDWIGLAVIALPCLLYSMDLTVLYLAVPQLTADMNPSATQLLWMLDIYGFLVAGCLITMGTLGDRIGRRKVLLFGAAAFGVASVLAAFSTTAEMLIVTRALLGIAAATLAPSTLSLIRNMFLDPQQRTVAISIWATSFSVGGAIGPLIGGIMLEYFWWGSVFLIGVPVMVVLLIVGPKLLPEFRDPNAGRLDILSAALSIAAVLAVIYALKLIAAEGPTPDALMALLGGVGVGVLFVRRQAKLADPLIDLTLFRSSAFCAAIATNMLSIFVAFSVFMFTSQYLQLVLGFTPFVAGLWTVPSSIGFVVGSMGAPYLLRFMRPATGIATGLVTSAIGLIILIGVDSEYGLIALVVGSTVMALGLAPTVTLTTDFIMGIVPPERAGAASGLSETATEFGGALGIAVLGSFGTAIYRGQMADSMPSGVPPEAAEAARSTLGAAVSAANRLPAPVGPDLIEAARSAFTHSLELTSIICALIATAAAFLVVIVVRRAQPNASA
ncbi:MAG: transporter [Rhodospirillales bacterium]|jgi:DHA2 family multidrug resistance protein-like MFS transporter|nr:transporter [Rhodospirillales bacterium]